MKLKERMEKKKKAEKKTIEIIRNEWERKRQEEEVIRKETEKRKEKQGRKCLQIVQLLVLSSAAVHKC